MIMLSQLLRFRVVDGQGRRARLVDASLGGLDADYPRVDKLLIRAGRRTKCWLPWTAITEFDRQGQRLQVEDLRAAKEVRDGQRPEGVWLKRDVRDAIIINLRHRHVTVVNDVLLSDKTGQPQVRAVATGPWALVPRLTGHFHNSLSRSSLNDWQHIQYLRGQPQAADGAHRAPLRLAHLPAGEIAHLAGPLPYLHAAELVGSLAPALAADVLEEMPLERIVQIFEELPDEQAQSVLSQLAPDVAANLLGRLDPDEAHALLERLPATGSERLIELLRYPADTVGGAMTNDIIWLPAGLSAGQARAALRERLKEPDFTYFLYVVDDNERRHLLGALSLRRFVTADDRCRVDELMQPQLLKLAPLELARPAARRLLDSGLAALPVVSSEGRLLGALTVDAAVELVAPRNWSSQAPRVFS
jgi:magnesium transporter